jgi:hypothetical protein
MKLIEPTQRSVEKDRIQMVADKIVRVFQYVNSGEHAEDAIVARFMRGLDNRFVMLRNLQLEGKDEIFPPILVGPSGLVVLNVCRAKGFFKAKDDSWWEMNKTSQRFGPARLNLLRQSKDYAQKLAEILDAHGKSHPEILPVLVFANPGVHVEASNPAIRIVLMDGVESLIDSFRKGKEVLQPTEVNFLSDSLEIMANPEKAIPMSKEEDFFGRDLLVNEKKAPLKLPEIPIPTELSLPPIEQKVKFSRKQWIILEVLLILTIVILLGAIIYVLKVL